ncbi:MAG TPA: VgrG-related protein [Acidimicrobiales bacterium]|nr:VgrG-related protein [Acidimicrobiales bacterium]
MAQNHTYDLEIKVDNVRLPSQITDNLLSAVIDDGVQQSDVVELRFRDQARTLLSGVPFRLGAAVKVSVTSGTPSTPQALIEAEITALEAEYDLEVGSVAIVRGFDRAHKLFRGRKNKNFVMVKASDVASTVASANGLTPDVDATTTVYAHLSQANESDWAFLKRLAAKSGYVLSVTGRKLSFKRPDTPALSMPITLAGNEDLLRARIGYSSNEQVQKVVARSYDAVMQQPLVGTMPLLTTVARMGTALPMVQAAAAVTQEYLSTDTPLENAGEAIAKATALSKQIAEGYVELHAETFGNPKLKAGSTVVIQGMGTAFNGTFRVTSTRHVFTGDSLYTTEFDVTGARDDSFLGLVGGGGSAAAPADRIEGVMVGVVTDNSDPMRLGRVKVKIPALGETFTTGWAQVVYPGAGGAQARGLQLVPEVGDHVIVAFELGDINRPFVLGGIYTNTQKPPQPNAVTNRKVTQRTLVSNNGDFVLMEQATDNEHITISSQDKKVFIKLGTGRNAQKHVLEIATDLDVVVKAGRDAQVTANRDVNVEAKGKLTIKAATSATIEASTTLTLKGATVKVEASGPCEVKGSPIKLN